MVLQKRSLIISITLVLINTTYESIHFLNQVREQILGSGAIDPQTGNNNDLYYKCSKYGSDFLFGKLMIRDNRNKLFFRIKINKIPDEYYMKIMHEKK